MLSTEYFRRQADICLRLSVISSSDVMAHEYQIKADPLEAHAGSLLASIPITPRRPEASADAANCHVG